MRLLLKRSADGGSQAAEKTRRAGADFVRNQEAGGNANNGSTAHPTPPEIPLRLRRALSGKPESSTALKMTRAATQKLSLRGTKKGTALIANVIQLTRKEPPPLGEVARESVTERAWGKEFPSQPPCGASSP